MNLRFFLVITLVSTVSVRAVLNRRAAIRRPEPETAETSSVKEEPVDQLQNIEAQPGANDVDSSDAGGEISNDINQENVQEEEEGVDQEVNIGELGETQQEESEEEGQVDGAFQGFEETAKSEFDNEIDENLPTEDAETEIGGDFQEGDEVQEEHQGEGEQDNIEEGVVQGEEDEEAQEESVTEGILAEEAEEGEEEAEDADEEDEIPNEEEKENIEEEVFQEEEDEEKAQEEVEEKDEEDATEVDEIPNEQVDEGIQEQGEKEGDGPKENPSTDAPPTPEVKPTAFVETLGTDVPPTPEVKPTAFGDNQATVTVGEDEEILASSTAMPVVQSNTNFDDGYDNAIKDEPVTTDTVESKTDANPIEAPNDSNKVDAVAEDQQRADTTTQSYESIGERNPEKLQQEDEEKGIMEAAPMILLACGCILFGGLLLFIGYYLKSAHSRRGYAQLHKR